MAVSPVKLLDAADEVGFGPIINMGETPVKFVAFAVEPSSDATIDSQGGIAQGIMVQYSHDASFPQPAEGHDMNWATGFVTYLPLSVQNPEGNPAPQNLINFWTYETPGTTHGQSVVYPYMRAKLLEPLVAGTVTVEFYFE